MQKVAFSADRLIGNCGSWERFWTAAADLSEKQKGDVFERLVQLYLLTKPKYNTELSAVWLVKSEVPADVRWVARLKLREARRGRLQRQRDREHDRHVAGDDKALLPLR